VDATHGLPATPGIPPLENGASFQHSFARLAPTFAQWHIEAQSPYGSPYSAPLQLGAAVPRRLRAPPARCESVRHGTAEDEGRSGD
jgi:hypothetical protein